MDPGRHEIVSSALGRRLGEDRRLDLEEVEIAQCLPGALQQPMAQHEIPLQLGAAEIEMTVFEPQLLGGKLFSFSARHRDRGRFGGPDDRERGGVDFDVSRDEVGVAHRRRPSGDFALDQ